MTVSVAPLGYHEASLSPDAEGGFHVFAISRFGVVVLVSLLTLVLAAPDAPGVSLYLFWGDGCPHCAAEKRFLDELLTRQPGLEIRSYEVYHDAANRRLYAEMAAAYGFEAGSVPATFVADSVWVGFSDRLAPQIEGRVAYCLEYLDCSDPADRLSAASRAVLVPSTGPDPEVSPGPTSTTVTLPLVGSFDLAARSLFVVTGLIALVDGFNPCSLWVLSLLLAVVIHSGSRRRILLVGGTFLTVTSLTYGLFIAGIFNVLAVISYLDWIRLLVAAIAMTFGLINIVDYVSSRSKMTLTIADRYKPGIYRSIRRVAQGDRSLWAAVAGTAAMAFGITVVELPCTAGFPVIWSGVVADRSPSLPAFLLLLLVYIAVYLIDELVVFSAAVVTLKAGRLEERHGRLLKLLGGVVMISLATVLLIRPELMTQLGAVLGVFAAALGVGVIITLADRFRHRSGRVRPDSN